MNMGIKSLLIIALCCVPGSLYAANNNCYIPEGTVKERLAEGIGSAQHCIDICIHDFAALDIVENLENAKANGVKLHVVILERDSNTSRGSLAETLIQKEFDVRVLKPQLSNNPVQDFIVLDDRMLITGVYNWLAYRNRNICNDVLFHYDPDRIHAHKNMFYRLFTEGEAPTKEQQVVANNFTVIPRVTDSRESTTDQPLDKEPEKPVPAATSKYFITVSFEELDKQFGKESNLSRSEKNELWKNYEGKYVRWHGFVSYRGMGRVDWNHVGISRQKSKNAEVGILFDWRMFEKVMSIKEGNSITYTGRLVSRPVINAPYRLDDGDIDN